MELIIWRHAEAEVGSPDMTRRLTERGRRQATRMAKWLNQRLPEDVLILVGSWRV
jgi:phosphohistidine phosphatase